MITAAVAATPTPIAGAPLMRAQVEIGLRAGHLEAARAAAARLRQTSDEFASPGFLAWADDAEGAVLLAAGDAAAALAPLQAAASAYHRTGARCDAAAVEAQLSRAHALLGNLGEAETHAGAAASLVAALGLAATTRPAPGGLTEREVEVLVLVAGGASNREVAATLFLSEATVRRHLANVFRKLDVTSRTAASSWAHQHSLL